MTIRPTHLNAYEFVLLSALRAQQLLAGCTARLPGTHSAATMALRITKSRLPMAQHGKPTMV